MAQPAAEVPARSLDFNEDGCSVRCRLYASNARSLRGLVIYCHGFAGHKETKAAQRMARALMAKKKDWGLLCFDWPCHGQDGRKKLSLSDCLQYLDIVVRQARALWQPEELLACATSFGAYCLLNYLVRYGCPFGRIALRCPAIDMYTLLTGTILPPLELEKLEKGKPAEAGFDRLIRITPEFLAELRENDLRRMDFLPWAEQILILHGTKDEIVPIGSVESFADEQLMEFEPVENADHRFQDPKIMDLAIARILKFYFE